MNRGIILKLLGVLLLAVAVVVTSPKQGSDHTVKIGILQLLDHVSLDETREGFVNRLMELGYYEGEVEFVYLNAQGDQSNLKVMSQQLVSNNVELIFAITTPAAQAVANETSEIPIITGAVTDLVGANLVESNEVPGTNVSGTSDMTPIAEQLALVMELAPKTQTLGFIYNTSETNSQILVDLAEELAIELGLETVRMGVTNTNDVAQNMQALAQRVDAVFIPTDNTLASSMATVGRIAEQYQLPVIAGSVAMVEEGGLATVGVDYYELGRQGADMAARVLEGEDISQMPVEFANKVDVFINEEMAEKIGITLPQQ